MASLAPRPMTNPTIHMVCEEGSWLPQVHIWLRTMPLLPMHSLWLVTCLRMQPTLLPETTP